MVLVRSAGLEIRERVGFAVLVVHKIHHEVRHAELIVIIEVEDPRDVRMTQSGQNLAFCKEPLPEQFDVTIGKRKGLEGVMDAELHMLDFIDRPHAALSKHSDNAVLVDLVSWLQVHSSCILPNSSHD